MGLRVFLKLFLLPVSSVVTKKSGVKIVRTVYE